MTVRCSELETRARTLWISIYSLHNLSRAKVLILATSHTKRDTANGARLRSSTPTCRHIYQSGDISYRNERFLETKETKINLQVCGGCQRLKYCSKPCQTKAWQEYHKLECDPKRMKQVQKASHTTQILIRLLYKIMLGLVNPIQLMAMGQLESKKTKWMAKHENQIKHDVLFTRLQTKSPLKEIDLQNILCTVCFYIDLLLL